MSDSARLDDDIHGQRWFSPARFRLTPAVGFEVSAVHAGVLAALVRRAKAVSAGATS